MLKTLVLLLLTCITLSAQTLTFEEFSAYSLTRLDSAQLAGIIEYLPEKFVITGADIGDISGDAKNDFAVAVRPSIRKSRDIYVYIFVDSSNAYIPVFRDTLKFVELPIEIAFTISEQTCIITQKLKENSWLFTGYSFVNNELALVDLYRTGDKSIDRRSKIGNEFYENFKSLHSYNGFYNWNTLRDYKKNKFYNFPVYDQKRNIYKNYTRSVYITSSWLWNDSLTEHINYGKINFARKDNLLLTDITLNDKILTTDSLSTNYIKIYFDRSPQRLVSMNKRRMPVFRSSTDENIAYIQIELTKQNPYRSSLNYNFGENYSLQTADHIRVSEEQTLQGLKTSLQIPIEVFNTDTAELGIYISIEKQTKGDTLLTLRNSDGTAEDPSSYGRLIFIEPESYYGEIKNNKFKELIDKIKLNNLD